MCVHWRKTINVLIGMRDCGYEGGRGGKKERRKKKGREKGDGKGRGRGGGRESVPVQVSASLEGHSISLSCFAG